MLFVAWYGMCAPLKWRLARMLPGELRRCTVSAKFILNPVTWVIVHCKVVSHTRKALYKKQLILLLKLLFIVVIIVIIIIIFIIIIIVIIWPCSLPFQQHTARQSRHYLADVDTEEAKPNVGRSLHILARHRTRKMRKTHGGGLGLKAPKLSGSGFFHKHKSSSASSIGEKNGKTPKADGKSVLVLDCYLLLNTCSEKLSKVIVCCTC